MAGRKNRDLGCGEIVQNELSRHNIFLENGVHSFEELEGQLMCSVWRIKAVAVPMTRPHTSPEVFRVSSHS